MRRPRIGSTDLGLQWDLCNQKYEEKKRQTCKIILFFLNVLFLISSIDRGAGPPGSEMRIRSTGCHHINLR